MGVLNQKTKTTWGMAGMVSGSLITLERPVPVHVPRIHHVEIGWSWTCAGTSRTMSTCKPFLGLAVLSSNVAADSRCIKTLPTKIKTRTCDILWHLVTWIDRVTFPLKWRTTQATLASTWPAHRKKYGAPWSQGCSTPGTSWVNGWNKLLTLNAESLRTVFWM